MDKLILEDGVYLTEIPQKTKAAVSIKKDPSEIRAPIPGVIIDIRKKIGDEVKLSEPVLTLDAMKMENEIASACSGMIEKIFAKVGDKVKKNDMLIKIETRSPASSAGKQKSKQ